MAAFRNSSSPDEISWLLREVSDWKPVVLTWGKLISKPPNFSSSYKLTLSSSRFTRLIVSSI